MWAPAAATAFHHGHLTFQIGPSLWGWMTRQVSLEEPQPLGDGHTMGGGGPSVNPALFIGNNPFLPKWLLLGSRWEPGFVGIEPRAETTF